MNQALIEPKSIVVVGASKHTNKIGGKVLANLIEGKFKGEIYAVNPHPFQLEGVNCYASIQETPQADLAILAIPAELCYESVSNLLELGTKAFIIYSAGFAEVGTEGLEMETQLNRLITDAGATLIGTNCIGVINAHYKGVFTSPVPTYYPEGCELISSSGATAVFIMEAAQSMGLKFSSIYSIGNATQIGVEEILEYLDQNFDPTNSPKIKLLYLENIKNPFKFLTHAASLIRKGCHIAAIKSGGSEAGSRAASSHTGALATPDGVIKALFEKAGVVYCEGRMELITLGCIFQTQLPKGKNIGIITHAGGSAVMLSDALSKGGLCIPPISEAKGKTLLQQLNPGSSVANPIDFLATGTAEQLGHIIDFCADLDEIDALIVVFGSPGLFNVKDVYAILHEKIKQIKKPIYPVLPSLVNAKKEINFFLSQGNVNFPDEVTLGKALSLAMQTSLPQEELTHLSDMAVATIRSVINQSKSGYLPPEKVNVILHAAGIKHLKEHYCNQVKQVQIAEQFLKFPMVMKVIGPLHKTDVGGVQLNLKSVPELENAFQKMMEIPGAKGVLLQEMIEGEELFIGALKQGDFGHLIMCGFGGILLEITKDVAQALAPLTFLEAEKMVHSLKGYPLFKGYRKRAPIHEEKFIDALIRVSSLVHIAPEICEFDINPLKGTRDEIIAIDARIRIEK
jgi:acetate---CoA ligase (ADP-forming)